MRPAQRRHASRHASLRLPWRPCEASGGDSIPTDRLLHIAAERFVNRWRLEERMRITWLGWAGVEIEAAGERVVVDPLADAGAVFARLGERLRVIPLPDVVPARPGAIAGLL